MLDKSMNLARRLSARNEPDLLQAFDFNNVELFTPEESFVGDDDSEKENNNTNTNNHTSPSSSKTSSPAPSMPSSPTSPNRKPSYSLNYCEAIVTKLSSVNEHIPQECRKYQSVREALIRRRDSDHAVAFKGMHSGQAVSAMAARERGHLNPCQIQRRFTNRKASDRRVW